MNEHRFRQLIDSLIDDDLSPEDAAAMELAMNENADLKQIYLDAMSLHAGLAWPRRWSDANPVGLQEADKTHVCTGRVRPFSFYGAMIAACVLLLLMVLWQNRLLRRGEEWANAAATPRVQEKSSASSVRPEIEPSNDDLIVGVLSDLANVVWPNGIARAVGKPLRKGWLRFDSGIIQIDFFGGARLIVRGPAEIQLRSSTEALLQSGEARCYVGELGRGFRLLTGDSEVIDLGTSFGMRAVPNQKTEVHVFEGKIAIRQHSEAEPVELEEFAAVEFDGAKLSPVKYSKTRFPAYEDLKLELASQSDEKYQTWKALANTLSHDPSVLVHYTFENQQPDDIEVLNNAQTEMAGSPAAIIGATWSRGRWAKKTGLHFRERNDRVLFRVPGRHESVTYLIWARIDALMGERTALILSEVPARWLLNGSMHGEELAKVNASHNVSPVKTSRWTLDRAGRPSFNLAFEGSIGGTYKWNTSIASLSVAKRRDWGRWSCLAMTYDAANRTISHYHDGNIIASMPVKDPEPLLLQCIELGNLSVPGNVGQDFDNFRFYGIIDEVLIANRAFSQTEIAGIYQAGNNTP